MSSTDEHQSDGESLSIIPYDTNRDVVLRHADSVVYFDPESRQIILRNRTRDIDSRSPPRGDCPTCGRPWTRDSISQAHVSSPSASEDQPSFINNDYFRMLARSLPGSNESSSPPSPRRRTIQPARSRLASPPAIPPPDAEFLGSVPAPPGPAHGISETAFAPLYFEKFFTIEKELGKGGRGVVLLVQHVLDGVSLGQFACKRVPIGDDHTWLEKVLVEVQALQALSHQNLVSYRHVWLEDYQINNFGPSVPCAFILQQYCNGGDLHNYVCGSAQVSTTTQELKDRIRRRSKGEAELPRKPNEPRKLHFQEIYSFFQDITAGLKFLHLNGFIHRDLKPSNCLLHTIGGETRILVSDFGEVQYEYSTRKSTGATGTISYCAPEVLRRESPDGPFGNFTFKSDIFSLGMILHFLCFADLPYRYSNVLHEEREDLTELRAEIMSWAGFDDHRRLRPELPPKLYSFLKRLLSLDPDNRPTAAEVNDGIRLGGLDQVPDARRRQSMGPEELTPGRRIQKVDTPVRGTSPNRGASSEASHANLHSGLRRRLTSRELPTPTNGLGISSDTAIEDDDHTSADTRSTTDKSSPSGRSNSVALIPRPLSVSMSSSPASQSPPLRQPLSPGLELRQQFLLPPPRRQSPLPLLSIHLRSYLVSTVKSPTLRISVLALKMFTALQPCMTRGMNPLVLYPVLGLALLELTIFPLQTWKSLLGLVVHGLVLWYAARTDALCRTERLIWKDGP